MATVQPQSQPSQAFLLATTSTVNAIMSKDDESAVNEAQSNAEGSTGELGVNAETAVPKKTFPGSHRSFTSTSSSDHNQKGATHVSASANSTCLTSASETDSNSHEITPNQNHRSVCAQTPADFGDTREDEDTPGLKRTKMETEADVADQDGIAERPVVPSELDVTVGCDENPGNMLLRDLVSLHQLLPSAKEDIVGHLVDVIHYGTSYIIADGEKGGVGRFLKQVAKTPNCSSPSWKVLSAEETRAFVGQVCENVSKEGSLADANKTSTARTAYNQGYSNFVAHKIAKEDKLGDHSCERENIVGVCDSDVLLLKRAEAHEVCFKQKIQHHPGNERFRAALEKELCSHTSKSPLKAFSEARARSALAVVNSIRNEKSPKTNAGAPARTTDPFRTGRFLARSSTSTSDRDPFNNKWFDVGLVASTEATIQYFFRKLFEYGRESAAAVHQAKEGAKNPVSPAASQRRHDVDPNSNRKGLTPHGTVSTPSHGSPPPALPEIVAKWPSQQNLNPPGTKPVDGPTEHDVLFGRGGLTNHHPGNRRFRDIIALHRPDYIRAIKVEKPNVARRIVTAIRTSSPPGRFLKKRGDGLWYDVGDRHAAEKASQALREKSQAERYEKVAMKKQEDKKRKREETMSAIDAYSSRMRTAYDQMGRISGKVVTPVAAAAFNGMGVPAIVAMIPSNMANVKDVSKLTHFAFPAGFPGPLMVASPAALDGAALHKSAAQTESTAKPASTPTNGLVGLGSGVVTTTPSNSVGPSQLQGGQTCGGQRGLEGTPRSHSLADAPPVAAQPALLSSTAAFDLPSSAGPTDEEGNILVTDHDILCGRGGLTNHHKGNKRFRDIVGLHRPDYVRAPKIEKPAVARLIVSAIRNGNPPGRFLKKDDKTGLWFDIGDKRAAEKASQALREKSPEERNRAQATPTSPHQSLHVVSVTNPTMVGVLTPDGAGNGIIVPGQGVVPNYGSESSSPEPQAGDDAGPAEEGVRAPRLTKAEPQQQHQLPEQGTEDHRDDTEKKGGTESTERLSLKRKVAVT